MRIAKRNRVMRFAAGVGVAWLLTPNPARAANHLWELSELFSNSSGSVQFVEMVNDFNFEGFISGLRFESTNTAGTETHTFTFSGNTSDVNNTADHYVLVATEGFGDLPGGVEPDFELPSDFLFTGGGTLKYSSDFEVLDSVTYDSLPIDGTMSLERNFTVFPHTLEPAINSPTNFDGDDGEFNLPPTLTGDFNNDAVVNAADIDLLCDAVDAGGPAAPFDVNGDGSVNQADITFQVEEILDTNFGDTDTDGDVDLNDLGNLASGFQVPGEKRWSRGNFDCDDDVDLPDLGTLATNFQAGRAAALAQFEALVPEPAAGAIALVSAAACCVSRFRRAVRS